MAMRVASLNLSSLSKADGRAPSVQIPPSDIYPQSGGWTVTPRKDYNSEYVQGYVTHRPKTSAPKASRASARTHTLPSSSPSQKLKHSFEGDSFYKNTDIQTQVEIAELIRKMESSVDGRISSEVKPTGQRAEFICRILETFSKVPSVFQEHMMLLAREVRACIFLQPSKLPPSVQLEDFGMQQAEWVPYFDLLNFSHQQILHQQEQFQDREEQLNMTIAALRSEISSQRNDIEQLSQQRAQFLSFRKSMELELLQAKHLTGAVQQRLFELEAELQKSRYETSVVKQEREAIRLQEEAARDERDKLSEEKEEFVTEHHRLQNVISCLESKMRQQDNESLSVATQLRDSHLALEKLQQEYQELETSLRNLRLKVEAAGLNLDTSEPVIVPPEEPVEDVDEGVWEIGPDGKRRLRYDSSKLLEELKRVKRELARSKKDYAAQRLELETVTALRDHYARSLSQKFAKIFKNNFKKHQYPDREGKTSPELPAIIPDSLASHNIRSSKFNQVEPSWGHPADGSAVPPLRRGSSSSNSRSFRGILTNNVDTDQTGDLRAPSSSAFDPNVNLPARLFRQHTDKIISMNRRNANGGRPVLPGSPTAGSRNLLTETNSTFNTSKKNHLITKSNSVELAVEKVFKSKPSKPENVPKTVWKELEAIFA